MSSLDASYETSPVTAIERWLIVAAVCLGTMATILTATIINVAVPEIMGTFGIGQERVQWVSTGYLAAMTSAMLMCDWSIRQLGERNTYVLGIVVFVGASFLGGMAENFDVLILSRVLQGASSGLLQPLAFLAMFRVYPSDERGKAMGVFGLAVILAPAVGPYVGGIAVDLLNWRWVYFLPLPFAALAGLIGAVSLAPRNPDQEPIRFDWIGMILLVIGIGGLLTGLSNGTRDGWYSNNILGYISISTVSTAAFIFWELYIPHPLLNIRVFKHFRFVSAAIVSFVFGAAMFATMYLVPLFVQIIQGYSPTRSGLMLLPAGLAMAIAFPIFGKLSDRGGMHLLTIAGMTVIAYSTWLMVSAHVDTPFWAFAWWMVLNRIGLSIVFPPLSAASVEVLPADLTSQGQGVMNFVRSLGGAFGVNLVAISVDFRATGYRSALVETQNAGNPVSWEFMESVRRLLATAGLPDTLQEPTALFYLGRSIVLQADMLAYRDGFLLMAFVSAAAIVPAWFVRRTNRRAAE